VYIVLWNFYNSESAEDGSCAMKQGSEHKKIKQTPLVGDQAGATTFYSLAIDVVLLLRGWSSHNSEAHSTAFKYRCNYSYLRHQH